MAEETNVTPSEAQDEAPAAVAEETSDNEASGGDSAGTVVIPQPELNDSLNAVAPAERKDVPGGRAYEIIYVVRVGGEESAEANSEKLRGFVESHGGAVDNVRISEVRRLAYPISKQIEGIYVVINGRFVKDLTTELDRFFKLDESVLRHMVLRDND